MEWKEVTISDIAILKNGKKRPSETGKIPAYGGNGIMDYVNCYNDENCIAIGRVGAYCGCVYLTKGKVWISDNAISAKANSNADNIFLYYLLDSLNLNLHRIGGAQPLMTQDLISRIRVLLPSLEVQRKIASILSSLDEKIENNNKIIANLEAQAHALYKSWFIDFEPFKDGAFVESELGVNPMGWKIDKICNINHILETGKRPKGGVQGITNGVPSIGAENIKGLCNFDFSKTKYITEEFATSMKRGKVLGYELLIYKDGGTPGNYIPNYSIFGEGYPFDNMYLNEHVFKLDLMDAGYNFFAYCYFRTHRIMSYLNTQGAKAAIPGINSKDIENIPILSFDNAFVKNFCSISKDVITKMLLLGKESARLAQLRDTLLPKLMSGKIEV